MQAFRRQGFRQLALWLALAAAALRVLLPDGFMPQRGPAGQGYGLAICYAGPLARLRAEQGVPAGAHAHEQCPFAAAAGPLLASAGQPWSCAAGPAPLQAQRAVPALRGTPPRLLPPARAPPLFS